MNVLTFVWSSEAQATLCRKSWVFSGCSSFLPQGKLTGWVRINTVKKVISRVSTGLENPGKSLNWKNKIPGLESP